MAAFLRLNAMYASAQQELDLAHQLSPSAPSIPATVAPTATTHHDASSCEVVNATPSATISLQHLSSGVDDFYAAAIELTLNGSKHRLELSTAASGLILTAPAARAAGLIPEVPNDIVGIGRHTPRSGSVAHVDDIRIGDLEYHHCLVSIMDDKYTQTVGSDGYIGTDVFADYLVTVDIPENIVKLAPLPPRPGDPEPPLPKLNTVGTTSNSNEDPIPRDRYVAPEMATWTRVFRAGHRLLFPTTVNGGPSRLFLLDTGVSHEGRISPDVAYEIGNVKSLKNFPVTGIADPIKNIPLGQRLHITFAGVSQTLYDVRVQNLTSTNRDAGVVISGLIGFVTLEDLVITIDYRDSLVHVVYDPTEGFHRKPLI